MLETTTKLPSKKINDKETFCAVVTCRFQIIFIGNKMITMSVTIFGMAFPTKKASVLMHCAGIAVVLSQKP